MHAEDLKKMALEAMIKHGLNEWRFRFDRAKRRLGACHHHEKTISLSLNLLNLPESEILETILHEIAHALVGPRAGHGPLWKQKALSIGCNGMRVSDRDMIPIPVRVIRCDACDYQRSFRRFRLPRWLTRKRNCIRCKVGKTSEFMQRPDLESQKTNENLEISNKRH